jgi:hypothetical protein
MTHDPTPEASPPTDPPQLGIRLVSAYGEQTRRVDLQLVGSRGVAVEDGLVTTFEAGRLWQTIRDLLPPLEQLTADPAGRPATEPAQVPGPGWDRQCRAMVSLAVVATTGGEAGEQDHDAVVVRTWFATEDGGLWSATPLPEGSTDIRRAPEGALADLLIWDVTGALEALVARAAS